MVRLLQEGQKGNEKRFSSMGLTSFEKKPKNYLKTQLSENMVFFCSFWALPLSQINDYYSNTTYMEALGNIYHLMFIWDAIEGFAICFYNE